LYQVLEDIKKRGKCWKQVEEEGIWKHGRVEDVLPIILYETKTMVEEEQVFLCYFAFSLHLSLDSHILEHLRFLKCLSDIHNKVLGLECDDLICF
jgi:hypothetical protein